MRLLEWIWSFLHPAYADRLQSQAAADASQVRAVAAPPPTIAERDHAEVRRTREPPPALPHTSPSPHSSGSAVGNLDHEAHVLTVLEGPAEDLLWRIDQRIERGDFEVPSLPPTSLQALELANRPSVEITKLVATIERDPVLTSNILRTANSTLYSTVEPAASLQQAIMRIGLRSVRGVVFSVSMQGTILKARGFSAQYSEEVWRQAQSVARIARAIGGRIGFDPEQAYVIGLLHDIGKIALLGLLEREMGHASIMSPALVGRAFHSSHQRAGRAMALAWKLPEELISIAGQHHDFAANTEHPRGAALAYLAHQLDLRLSLSDEEGFRLLVRSPAFDQLGVAASVRWEVLDLARSAMENAAEPSDVAAE